MAVNGLGQYNYWNPSHSKSRAENEGGRHHGSEAGKTAAQKTDSYKPTYDYSEEVKKDMAFAKANDIDYELAMKGQRYEGLSKSESDFAKKALAHQQKNEDFDAAIAEWGKFKEAKANAAKETAAPAETQKTAETPAKKAETYKPDLDKIRSMKADMRNNISAFKQMVQSLAKSQGSVSDLANGNLKKLLGDLSGMTQADAKAAIADDGYWGVDQTAGRILDFAKALSGGDPSKISMLRDAVQKGFSAAGKAWGGNLPGISHQTLAKVMQGFDEWEKSANETSAAAAAVE